MPLDAYEALSAGRNGSNQGTNFNPLIANAGRAKEDYCGMKIFR
jgi:hypothetical protein